MKLQHPGLMKVWKSPVFYFGMLLVVAVVGLLLAPFVVDWNGYRADLEAYGKKLTGRDRHHRRADLGAALSLAAADGGEGERRQSAGPRRSPISPRPSASPSA